MTVGLSWLLASLGVYLRDVGQIIGVVTTILMFVSPIFYPIAALPEEYRPFMQISPLTLVVEQARDVMIWGRNIDWQPWGFSMIFSSVIAWLGFAWFQKTRKGFADVI
jgi:lipopolysaccharide transport system permease protein